MLVTRALASTGANNVTVSQQGVQLACGTTYTPTTAEIYENLNEPNMNISQTYTYCVQVGATVHECVAALCWHTSTHGSWCTCTCAVRPAAAGS